MPTDLLQKNALPDLTAECLRSLMFKQGYATAIEALDATLRSSQPHADFIQTLESSAPLPALPNNLSLLIVPGAFYREYRQTGADGQRFIDKVKHLPLHTQTIPTLSTGTLAQNAGIITRWLIDHPAPAGHTRILVSFSKGSADLKTAMAHPQNDLAFQSIHAWLSVGGILHGTPLIAWLHSQKLRHFLIRQYFRLRRIPSRMLEELAHGPATPLALPTRLPTHLRLYHLIAFPTHNDLSFPLAQRAFQRLLPLGPNDAGGLLLSDLPRFPGAIYPLRNTDHYMRNNPHLSTLLTRILQIAASPNL